MIKANYLSTCVPTHKVYKTKINTSLTTTGTNEIESVLPKGTYRLKGYAKVVNGIRLKHSNVNDDREQGKRKSTSNTTADAEVDSPLDASRSPKKRKIWRHKVVTEEEVNEDVTIKDIDEDAEITNMSSEEYFNIQISASR